MEFAPLCLFPWGNHLMKIPIVELPNYIKCAGCIEICPEVFKLNDFDYIEVADLGEYPETMVDEAINFCPNQGISWIDNGG